MKALIAIATRKTTRDFKRDQITETELDTILGAGSSAPAALGDYGNIHFTVVENSGLLLRLSGESKKKPLYGAPTLVLISAKPTPYPNIEFFNTACVIENMLIAATALGLGSAIISGASEEANGNPGLLAELGLPESYFPVGAVALGYPAKPLGEKTDFKRTVKINRID